MIPLQSALRASRDLFGDAVHVRDYIPLNGIDDDYPGFQAAIIEAFGNRAAPKTPTQYRQLIVPRGLIKTSQELLFESVSGGLISGAGRGATKIVTTAANGSVFKTNGFQYNRVENMWLQAAGTGSCIDLDWDNTGYALQSNQFSNLLLAFGAFGCRIANSGFMGSENTFYDSTFQENTTAGLSPRAFNALQNKLIGGNIQGCGTGVLVFAGSVTNIVGTGFQQSINWDIDASTAGVADIVSVCGVRTESPNFAKTAWSQSLLLQSITQVNPSAIHGSFAEAGGQVSIDCCVSIAGKVIAAQGGDIRNSQFGRSDWIDNQGTQQVNVSNVYKGSTFSGLGEDPPAPVWLGRGYVTGTTFTAA
jgi:hypothetical protein